MPTLSGFGNFFQLSFKNPKNWYVDVPCIIDIHPAAQSICPIAMVDTSSGALKSGRDVFFSSLEIHCVVI
jgi:hypothetical protein